MITRRSVLFGAGTLLPAVTACTQQAVREERNIAYFTGADADPVRHRLDLYLPPAAEKKPPLLLFVHGGAWTSGSKDLYAALGRAYAGRGIAVAAANYRLSPAVKHPEHARDVARAIGWLARNADARGFDATRLFASGHSAGGHLVALIALDPTYLKAEGLTPSRLKGVIGISGPYILAGRSFEQVFGDDAAARRGAFPLNHLDDLPAKEMPRFLILVGDRDLPGLQPSARLLAKGLKDRGADVREETLADRDHISIITRIAAEGDPGGSAVEKFVKS